MMEVDMARDPGAERGDVLGPTPERRRHDRFRTIKGVTRVVGTIRALQDSGDIGSDEVEAAARWYRDYIFSAHGAVDDDQMSITRGERGDIHTWMISRGKSSARISDVKGALGLCAHVRLQMMLAQEMSFSAMARVLYAGDPGARVRMKVSAQCAFLLEQLAAFYRTRAENRQ